MKLSTLLCTLSLAFAGTFYSSVSAADTPTKAAPPPKSVDGQQVQSSGTGLYSVIIGDHFLALLPEKLPQPLIIQEFLQKCVVGNIDWQVTDSRSLGEKNQFGLTLKSPTDSNHSIPYVIHLAGMPKMFDLKATARFELSPEGNLVATIGKEMYPVIKKAEMKKYTASLKTDAASGLATTAGKKPATRQ